MSRQSVAGGRPHIVSVRLSGAEVAEMDARRGSLSRTEWLRWLTVKAKRDDTRFAGQPRVKAWSSDGFGDL